LSNDLAAACGALLLVPHIRHESPGIEGNIHPRINAPLRPPEVALVPGAPFPARACYEVKALPKGAKVEISAIIALTE
jgi:hypothetical protein